MRTKYWSMAFELATIEDAVEGARMLVDLVVNEQAQDDNDAARAPAAASAVLALTSLRLRDVGRVLRGEIEAEHLRGAHNATDEKVVNHDVVVRQKLSRA